MAAKKTAKKLGIWISVFFALLSAFGIPIRPEIVSVVEIYNQTVDEIEQVDSPDYETETELEK